MNQFYHAALQKLGFRQKAYQSAFAQGTPLQMVLIDLAKFSGAFVSDPDGMTHDQLMTMHGRRQMFFRIFSQIKMTPQELEEIAKPALIYAASRLDPNLGGNDE